MLEIRAHTYRNSNHKDSAGYCCDLITRSGCISWLCGGSRGCQCDNYFRFCLRSTGTSHDDNAGNCPLGRYTTREVGDDDFSFGSTSIASGVPNPMTFTGSVWPVSFFFYFYVHVDYTVIMCLGTCCIPHLVCMLYSAAPYSC